ncbi:hypothetical protein [Paraburkholderia sp. SIMBA_054]|uniref:hypothetical protein n=1 Tax=Paraburkholderia sp. SIMBA_054 TaxID=3085795 RepID=UPI00397A14A9
MKNSAQSSVAPRTVIAGISIALGVALAPCGDAVAQTLGAACSPVGATYNYEVNGVMVCGPKGTWRSLMKPVPASSFGENAGIVSTVGDRFAGAIKTIIDAVQAEIQELFN